MARFDGNTTADQVVEAFAAEAKGKTFLITGPSGGGIGAATAISLAAGKPKTILLAGRSLPKIQPVIDEIKRKHPDVEVLFIKLDLASQASVREAAKEVNSKVDKLDVLINNAGVMAVKDYTTTVEDIELHFGANHIGHFLLAEQLMPTTLAAGKGARIINISSFGYLAGGVRYDDWNFKNGAEYNPWLAYAQSKTANILFASALAEKFKSRGVLAFSLNPGLITDTKLQDAVTPEMFQDGYKITMEALKGEELPLPALDPVSIPQGAATSLWAALNPDLTAHSGAFLVRCAIWNEPLRAYAVGKENQDRLWALSEQLIGEKFRDA